MGSPVEIPDLPVASIANDADQTILRQGMTDYSVTMGLIRNINIQNLNSLPGYALPTDYFLASRLVLGTPTNFKISFQRIGIPNQSTMYFYMNSGDITATLPNWAIVPGTGDCLLACGGGSVYTSGSNVLGTWSQPAFSVSLANMPAHTHNINTYKTSVGGLSSTYAMAANTTVGNQSTGPNMIQSVGNGTPIQLVNTWRPLAAVGYIARKGS
jgi:hypothetical protein